MLIYPDSEIYSNITHDVITAESLVFQLINTIINYFPFQSKVQDIGFPFFDY